MSMKEHTIYGVEGESEDFRAAATSARRTFKFFWRELSWERRRIVQGLDLAAVKVSFATQSPDPDSPSVENMWVTDVDFDGQSLSGVLMNEPVWVNSMGAGDPVTVPLTSLNDWVYVSDGRVFGGFTIDALRSGMSAAERIAHDQAWGLDFGEAGTVMLVPPAEGKSPVCFTRTLASVSDKRALNTLERLEHPMGLNAQSTVEQGLKEDPALVTDPDEEGWQMIHRETLAGNCNFVVTLLHFGADPAATNSNGHDALALARMAGWPRIIELLEGDRSNLEKAMQRPGFPAWPIGLTMAIIGAAGLYFVAMNQSTDRWGVRDEGFLSTGVFIALVWIFGQGLILCTGPWYFRLRERTPMWGKARALDLLAMLAGTLLAFFLHDHLGAYLQSV
ncbi:hypothetical protein ALQ80_04327 [Pseudomonas coronafaciens pv. oryzae]|nr:hypothetical protein ALQ80_04327 [Pseudomonas coronafaciens pv. oryzae]